MLEKSSFLNFLNEVSLFSGSFFIFFFNASQYPEFGWAIRISSLIFFFGKLWKQEQELWILEKFSFSWIFSRKYSSDFLSEFFFITFPWTPISAVWNVIKMPSLISFLVKLWKWEKEMWIFKKILVYFWIFFQRGIMVIRFLDELITQCSSAVLLTFWQQSSLKLFFVLMAVKNSPLNYYYML